MTTGRIYDFFVSLGYYWYVPRFFWEKLCLVWDKFEIKNCFDIQKVTFLGYDELEKFRSCCRIQFSAGNVLLNLGNIGENF